MEGSFAAEGDSESFSNRDGFDVTVVIVVVVVVVVVFVEGWGATGVDMARCANNARLFAAE